MIDLTFPKDKFTLERKIVSTAARTHEVIYKHYADVVYVSKPVAPEIQCMTIDIPVTVDDKPIDCTNSPILFAIRFGGYMTSKSGGQMMDMPKPPMPGPGMPPPGMPPHGGPGMPPPGMPPHGGPGMPPSGKKRKMPAPIKRDDRILGLALAAGMVVVMPGTRGRGLKDEKGNMLGKAPASIVDFKAAVRYLRHNKDLIPGNKEQIISHGLSAGGAMSALLGASGNYPEYEPYLDEIGAAKERDDIFASADFCPMCDLEHADAAYEWMYGKFESVRTGECEDQVLSKKYADKFVDYQNSLGFARKDNGQPLTAENYAEFLEANYIIPAANEYLAKLDDAAREAYLTEHPWVKWDGVTANFTIDDLHTETGRLKELPAFDSPNLTGECEIFGAPDVSGAHFSHTDDPHVLHQVKLMNPMHFIRTAHPGACQHWWIRLGTNDNGMSFSVAGNLAAGLEKLDKNVSLKFYWEAGHYMDLDPEDFVEWIKKITK